MRTEQCHTAICFLTLVRLQRSGRRKAFGPVFEEDDSTWSPALPHHPAVIKLRHKGEQRSFDSPQKAEDFISSMSQQKSYAAALRGDDGGAAAAVSSVRREGRDGRDGLGPSCPEGDDSRMNMDAS